MATEKKKTKENHFSPHSNSETVNLSDHDGAGSSGDINCIKSGSMSEIASSDGSEDGTKPMLRKGISYLEVSTQIHQTAKIEVHTKEMLYHHLCAFCCNSKDKGTAYEQKLYEKMDHFVFRYVYSALHIVIFLLSTLVYVLFILVGWYKWHHALTSFVYAWFIVHQVTLLLTANYRLFKIFFKSFAFWYKIVNVAVGIFSRQLCFDGTQRFTESPLHGLSGILCIFTFIFANAIVGAIKSYYWPEITLFKCCGNKKRLDLGRYLKTVLIAFMLILNGVQTLQLYFSHNDYVIGVSGYTISLRNTAMSAFNSANLWYLKQIYSDIKHPDMISTKVPFEWIHDQSSYDVKHPRFSDLIVKRRKSSER